MNKYRLCAAIAVLFLAVGRTAAIDFDTYFTDATLRLDYAFAGDFEHQEIFVDQLSVLPILV